MNDKTLCDCGHAPSVKPNAGSGGTGYGVWTDGLTYCYDCCAKNERQAMIDTGKATLYHVKRDDGKWAVTDWPGRLSFPVLGQKKSWHNIGRKRVDLWFVGPDDHIWHGYQIGDWNQIAHCKRTKRLAGGL